MINVVFLNSLFWWSLVICAGSFFMIFVMAGIGSAARNGCLLAFAPLFAITSNISGGIFLIALVVKILYAIGVLI